MTVRREGSPRADAFWWIDTASFLSRTIFVADEPGPLHVSHESQSVFHSLMDVVSPIDIDLKVFPGHAGRQSRGSSRACVRAAGMGVIGRFALRRLLDAPIARRLDAPMAVPHLGANGQAVPTRSALRRVVPRGHASSDKGMRGKVLLKKARQHDLLREDCSAKPALQEEEFWLRGQDLNLRPSGYEPDELPDCSTPRLRMRLYHRMHP